MSTSEDELRRIHDGPAADEKGFVLRVSFSADDPAAVVERAREVLGRVIGHLDPWPAEKAWPRLLPTWFVERCAPEPPEGPSRDIATLRELWESMSRAEKTVGSGSPWTLSGWLYYFDPTDGDDGGMGDDRSWWWWDAGTGEPGTGWIEVTTTGWPFETGSLYWLIEAAGGADPRY